MPSRLPVSALAIIGKKFGLKTAVLHGWDGNRQHIVTWGDTILNCDYAAQAGTVMQTAFKWEGVEEQFPSRVRALQNDKARLQAEVVRLQAEIDQLRGVKPDRISD